MRPVVIALSLLLAALGGNPDASKRYFEEAIKINESLSGSGGTKDVCHHPITVTCRDWRSDKVIARTSAW
jgi:hypothetical protein